MNSRRITIIGGLILVSLTVITGILVFAIMQRHTESILSTSLELSLHSRARLFQSRLEDQANDVITIATRPFLIQQIRNINTGTDKEKAIKRLQRGMDSFLQTGFTALVIFDDTDKEILRVGNFISNEDLNVPLHLPVPAALLWKDELILSTEQAFTDKGEKIGSIRTQARLPVLTHMLFDVRSLGETGELALCGPLPDNHMQCFPTLLHPEPFKKIPRVFNGARLPMDFALSGKLGMLRAEDYRGEGVVAVYMPMSNTGLGMVLKTDTKELFSTVHQQLTYVLSVVAALVVFGIVMLRWLVAPLVKKVVMSEVQMRAANIMLEEKEIRIRAIFENVDDGIIVVNAEGIIESTNPGVENIFGYKASEMIGQDASILLPEQAPVTVGDYLQRYLQTGKSSYIGSASEVLAARKDGSLFPMDIRITEMYLGKTVLFIGTMRDITDRKLSEEKIAYLATHDALTNLPNRHLLQDRIHQAISHAARHEGTKVALLFIDLDGFKQVNDRYGHNIGDQLLIEVTHRICKVLRSEDTTARQGGDEFIVTLPDLKMPEGAAIVAEKLIQSIVQPYQLESNVIKISASIGVALFPDDGADTETLLKHSDTAMYEAKLAGRGVYRFFKPEMLNTKNS